MMRGEASPPKRNTLNDAGNATRPAGSHRASITNKLQKICRDSPKKVANRTETMKNQATQIIADRINCNKSKGVE